MVLALACLIDTKGPGPDVHDLDRQGRATKWPKTKESQ